MATKKTPEERLQELEAKMAQLQNQKKALLARQKQEERKARTRRLIEVGAEVEAALGFSLDTPEARKALGDFLRDQEARGKWVSKKIEEALPKQEAAAEQEETAKEQETVSEHTEQEAAQEPEAARAVWNNAN